MTLQLLFLYIPYHHCRNVGLGLCLSKYHIHYQTLRVHIWCMAVLPRTPSYSSNLRSGNAAIFYLYYKFSRRQTTMLPTSPTSAPSCFSLSTHVRSSSGTPTEYCHHLTCGVGGRGSPVYFSTYHSLSSSGTPLLDVQERVVSGTSITISITYLAPSPA